jgi:hypothetical protein
MNLLLLPGHKADSDADQSRIFGSGRFCPIAWMSTERTVLGDHLTAKFDARSYGGRVESDSRFVTALGDISPYAGLAGARFPHAVLIQTDLTGGGLGLLHSATRFDRAMLAAPDVAMTHCNSKPLSRGKRASRRHGHRRQISGRLGTALRRKRRLTS